MKHSAVFLTFSGNCEAAFRNYQSCFGGQLNIEYFDRMIEGYSQKLVVKANLSNENFSIMGSDLVHNEGLKTGNNMAIYQKCSNEIERQNFIHTLSDGHKCLSNKEMANSTLIEITDDFGVRWIFEIDSK